MGVLDLKQQDLYHLESNLCQLCLQVKQSNLTARVSTWGCGHVQGGVARFGVCVVDVRVQCAGCVRVHVYFCQNRGGLGAQWCDAGVVSCCQNVSSAAYPDGTTPSLCHSTSDGCTPLPTSKKKHHSFLFLFLFFCNCTQLIVE